MQIVNGAPGITPLPVAGRYFDLYITPLSPARHRWLVRLGAWCLNHAGFSVRSDGADFTLGVKS